MKDTRESSRLGYALSTPHNLSPVVRSPTLGGGSCPLGDPEPQGLQRDAEAAIFYNNFSSGSSNFYSNDRTSVKEQLG